MPITINGSGTVTGISAGGLPDDSIIAADIAAGAVTPAKLSTGAPSWTSGGDLSFNSGYGSVATAYGARAWVNFNGTSTVAIRASGNVSSITDNGVGSYTVNFTTAMPDANYCACFGGGQSASISWPRTPGFTATTTTLDVNTTNAAGTNVDQAHVSAAIFR